MKLSVDLNEEQMLRLKKRTENMSTNPEQFLAQLLEPYTDATDEEFQLLESMANQFKSEMISMDEDEDWDDEDEDEDDEDWDEDEEEWEDDDERW